MHGAAIVPHHQIELLPDMGVHEFSLGRMFVEVTQKGALVTAPIRAAASAVREEALMFLLLIFAACVLALSAPSISASAHRSLWIAMLLVQALPYAAALGCMWLSTRPSEHSIALDRAASGAS